MAQGSHKPAAATAVPSFQGAGGNLFGYLSQTYGAGEAAKGTKGEKEAKSQPAAGISGLYEDAATLAQIQVMDDQLRLAFKKVQKKDIATKTKGLTELKQAIEAKTPEELDSIAGYYVYMYSRIMATEHERKLRELANTILGIFVTKDKKALGAHVAKLLPFWYMALCDPAQDVVNVARANYDLCFPKDRQPKVLRLCCSAFFALANEYLKSTKESITEDLGSMVESDKEDVYERVISSVLRSISYLFSVASCEEDLKQTYVAGVIQILRLEDAESPLAKLLSGKFKSGIRAASLEVIVSLLENVKDAVVKVHEGKLSEFVLYSVGENNIRIQNVLWTQALIKFVKTCGNCWAHINIKRAFLNKLYQCLRKAAYGASPALYQNFVIFLSLFPFIKLDQASLPKSIAKEEEAKKEAPAEEKKAEEKKEEPTEEEKKGKDKGKKAGKDKSDRKSTKKEDSWMEVGEQLEAIREIHSNLFSAIYSEESAIYNDKLVASYFDCCLLVLWKRILPFVQSNPEERLKKLAMETALALIETPLEIFDLQHAQQLPRGAYDIVGKALGDLFNNMRERKLPAEYVGQLEQHALTKMTELFLAKKPAVEEVHINLLHTMCMHIRPQTEGFRFSDALVKLMLDFHTLLRKQIVDDITLQKSGSKDVQSPQIVSKLHLFCLLTYKFLCVTDRPLLAQAYSQTKEGEGLAECEWLLLTLSSSSTDIEIVQYALLSVSAIFSSMGVMYQNVFDRLLSLVSSKDASVSKNAEGTKLMARYSINPVSVTWELESKFVLKKAKRERHPEAQKRRDLFGLVALMNHSKGWKEYAQQTLRNLLDPKVTAVPAHKELYVALAEYYISHMKSGADKNIENAALGEMVQTVEKEASVGFKENAGKFGLVEEVAMSFVNAFVNTEAMSAGPVLDKTLERFCQSLPQVLYEYLQCTELPISQCRMWDLVRKLLTPEKQPRSEVYYAHYVSVIQAAVNAFLKKQQTEGDTTKLIQYLQTFINVAKGKQHSEIAVLRDLLFQNAQLTKENCEGLFSELAKLRIFTELFLRGGVGSSVPAMLLTKEGADAFPYVGLAAEILKSLYLPCTSKTVAIRNQITLYADVDLIPFIVSPHVAISTTEDKQGFIRRLIKDLEAKAVTRGSLYPYALEHLLHQLICTVPRR